jgi:sugar lactone lactonase YvrE
MTQVLGMDKVKVWFDGIFTEPRLNHPEGVWVDTEGNVWCSGEEGEIVKISSDGSSIELIAKTGGFGLGITMDSKGNVYLCDQKFACVFRFNPLTKELVPFASGNEKRKMTLPNYAVVDEARGYLYVSNTQPNGPGVWRFSLDNGEGDLWYEGDCVFANGLALSADGKNLYLVESFASKVSKICIQDDGSAGMKEHVVNIPETIPDGLALDSKGRLYISCYQPSAVYRYDLKGNLELLVRDEQCVVLAHPTNISFRGDHELFCACLGRWHISVIDMSDIQ